MWVLRVHLPGGSMGSMNAQYRAPNHEQALQYIVLLMFNMTVPSMLLLRVLQEQKPKRKPHQADPETIRRWAEQAIQRQQSIFTAPLDGAVAGQPARLFYNRAAGPLPQVWDLSVPEL